MRMPGIPGMSSTKAITSAPASVSLTNAAAVGAREDGGAKSSHRPTSEFAHGAHTDPRTTVRVASTMMSRAADRVAPRE